MHLSILTWEAIVYSGWGLTQRLTTGQGAESKRLWTGYFILHSSSFLRLRDHLGKGKRKNVSIGDGG